MNPHQAVATRFDELVAAVAFRYGPLAQGIVLVLYEELIALRRVLADDPEAFVVRARARSIAAELAGQYERHGFRPVTDHPSSVVGHDPCVIQFSRRVFEDKHGAVAHLVAAETVEITGPDLAFVESGRPYMYVIDEDGRFLVWTRAFSFEELVFGRNRATVGGVPVAHPMLVPERLRALAAGEIVFVGAPRVRAVIVNNKSGHFRTPPSSGEIVVNACRSRLGLTEADIDLFIVGGVGSGTVQRIGQEIDERSER
ncbi:hypothetical protein HII36_36880 [Nonomuraea sp. NN258]|uniref:hypothetical protein n=1 Tax=Nonomuraea antri TaxID=2730852 RepID=UPI001569C8BC|nr:hypothetical protein [Nonomuraea antri]NRQ37372.1 hypothetical protein [Nonomuraea antri]